MEYARLLLYFLYCSDIALLLTGGRSIQDECFAHVRTSGTLLPGQVYVSDAGTLPCRKVAHAVGPRWSETRRRDAEDQLYQAVYSTLEHITLYR